MPGQHVDAADEHGGHQEQGHQPRRREVAGQDQGDPDDTHGRQRAVEQSAAASGDLDLDRQHGVQGAVDLGGELGVAAQDVGLPQGGAQVVACGDALLRRGRVVGPGRLLEDLALRDLRQQVADESEGGGPGQREQERGGPPRDRRHHPQRAGGQEGARGLPHAPAHQLADLPGVVVDPVEDLAHRLLGELGQGLGHGCVEQVGAELALGPVADRRPDGLGDRVHDRAADHAQRQHQRAASTWRRPRGGRRPPTPRTRRSPPGATWRSRGRSADGVRAASRPGAGHRPWRAATRPSASSCSRPG